MDNTFILFEGEKYPFVDDPMDLTLEQYIQVYQTINKEKEQRSLSNDAILELLSIVSKIPMDKIKAMSLVSLEHLCDLYKKVLEMKLPIEKYVENHKKEPLLFFVDNMKYSFQPSYPFTILKKIRRFEDLFQNAELELSNNLHYMMAILCEREGEVYDRTKLNEKAFLFKGIKIGVFYKEMMYFIQTRSEILQQNKKLFKQPKKKKEGEDKKPSFKSRVLLKWGWFHVMNKLLNKRTETIKELDEFFMTEIFELLNYEHDILELQMNEQKQNK
jgi:hypothetical protein